METPETNQQQPVLQIIKGGLSDEGRKYQEYVSKYLWNTPLNRVSIYPKAIPWDDIDGKEIIQERIFKEGRDPLQILCFNSKIPVFINYKYFGHIALMERCTFTKDSNGLIIPTPALKIYILFSELENEAYGADFMQLTTDMNSPTMETIFSVYDHHLICNLLIEREDPND